MSKCIEEIPAIDDTKRQCVLIENDKRCKREASREVILNWQRGACIYVCEEHFRASAS